MSNPSAIYDPELLLVVIHNHQMQVGFQRDGLKRWSQPRVHRDREAHPLC